MRKKGHFPVRGREEPAARNLSIIIRIVVGIISAGIVYYLAATT